MQIDASPKRILAALAGLGALAALLLPTLAQAQVAAAVRVSASGQCMNVANNALQQEAAVIQWPC